MWQLKEPSFQIICSIAPINALVRRVSQLLVEKYVPQVHPETVPHISALSFFSQERE